MTAFRQEMSRTIAAQQTKEKGWVRKIVGSLTPGNPERRLAKQAFAAYWESPNVSTLDTAIDHFRKAGPRRQREARTLAFRFFMDAMELYEGCSHRQEDLDRAIQTGNDARELWSDGTNPGVHGVILYSLASSQQHLYDQSTTNQASKQEAFELGVNYFMEVINNKHVGDVRVLARLQIGTLIMTRCTRENTTSRLEMCIEHWEYALKELNSAKSETESVDGRAILRAGITYQLGIAYQLQYRQDLDRDRRLQNLNTTIDCFEKAQLLFKEIKNPAFSLARVMFALATRLIFRWEVTNEQSDIDRAKELLKAAQLVENIDEDLKQRIMRVLTGIEHEIDGH